ncbi:hypothetical protein LshimejAT787_1701940 [Lyophyllum shimeji]|uniref:KA1 domain-containing protein n=1 Tax=Lyophyllum shimeji TaxID=47721 RepID=A0A9P3Q0E8_LYOSH|nr:hypothetical protein LshimejAT787_1701940 [Lyophyllum shimeji]
MPPPPPLPGAALTPSSLGRPETTTTAPAPSYPGLAIHRGAIDKTTITNHAPPEAMRRVRVALQRMGVIVQAEGEYRYRCIRPRRLLDKDKAVVGVDPGRPGDQTQAAMQEEQDDSDYLSPELRPEVHLQGFEDALPPPLDDEATLTNPDPPTSFAGFPLRGRSPPPVAAPPTSTSTSSSSSNAALLSTPSGPHAVAYGKHTEDPGDEVRFSVEITRFDRLDGTYSLDIRRLRGNLRSYKFVYDSVRTLAVLQ